ncbi:MAG: acyl-CoA desaturase [Nitriliruptoraceae bacterium]|nr:acyl-CoA desaturase [Nitriliruptoraceae bacterium]
MAQLTAPPTARDESPTIRGATQVDGGMLFGQRLAIALLSILPLLAIAAAIIGLWGTVISGVDLALFLGFYVLSGLGITVGFHRLLTHQSFRAPTAVRVFFAAAGSLAIQGSVIDWVATHRRHHAYSDQAGDPHSPHVDVAGGSMGLLKGLWYGHMGWLFTPDATVQQAWAPDLLREKPIATVSKLFPWMIVASFALPALLGGLITGSIAGAFSGLIWGGLVRIFVLHHVTWSINSICHVFGTRPFESHDEARNNPVMALLGFGEGWHNAHHAFPASARHGLRWWELDLSWIVISTLGKLGLASNIKTPSARQMERRTRWDDDRDVSSPEQSVTRAA